MRGSGRGQSLCLVVVEQPGPGEEAITLGGLEAETCAATTYQVDGQVGVRPVLVLRATDPHGHATSNDFRAHDAEQDVVITDQKILALVAHRRRAVATAA